MPALLGSPNLVLRGLKAAFMEGVQSVRPSLIPRIAQEIPSDGASEKYIYPTAMPKPRKWTDERAAKSINALLTYELTNETYELSLEFGKELLDDCKVFALSDLLREAGMSCEMHPDELLSLLVQNGDQSGYTAYDGQIFYVNNAHKFAGAGTSADNVLTGSGTTVTDFKSNFQIAVRMLKNFKDNEGRLFNNVQSGRQNLVAHVPTALEYIAREALNASMIAATNNIIVGEADVIADGYLDDTNDWYLHLVGMPQKPFIYQNREPLSVVTLGPDSEFCTRTGKVGIYARRRFKLGYHRWERSIMVTNT